MSAHMELSSGSQKCIVQYGKIGWQKVAVYTDAQIVGDASYKSRARRNGELTRTIDRAYT